MPRPFLTARWSHICLFTYDVAPDVLAPHLPPGLELDLRDGRAFVSLVAFDFLDTRVLGVRWPGYRDFPEINLRFYVRQSGGGDESRGVVFIREFVPLRLVAWLARAIYNEPYRRASMSAALSQHDGEVSVEHRLTWGGRVNTLGVRGVGAASCPAADSVEHFFKEHRWGYGVAHGGQCLRYEVTHPRWHCYRVAGHSLHWDWRRVYGPSFASLQDASPLSVILAVGSEVAVYPQGRAAGNGRRSR